MTGSNEDLRAAEPSTPMDLSAADLDRFWRQVQKGPDCWLWTGTRTTAGYGQFNLHDRHWQAHRVAWQLTNGPIPDGLWALHHCDVPHCVRPDHVFLGTHTDNMRDAADKHRTRNGPMANPPTHCAKGHPYAEFGVRYGRERHLFCHVCSIVKSRERRVRQRTVAA